MKNITHLRLYISIIFLFAFVNSNAQFQAASVTEHITGLLTPPKNTASDILDDGGDVYRVSTINGPSFITLTPTPIPGLKLVSNVDFSGSSFYNVPVDIAGFLNHSYSNDVCLVKDIGDGSIHALVVNRFYLSFPSSCRLVIEDFIWQGSPVNSFVSLGVKFLGSNPCGTAVNIDADDNGNFAIVYDDAGQLNFITGSVNNAASVGLTFNNATNPVPSASGDWPDLSIMHSSTGTWVYYSYLSSTTSLEVRMEDFNNFVSGFSTPVLINTLTAASGYIYRNPRIATPNFSGAISGKSEWEVVVEETDFTQHNIIGFNPQTSGGGFPIPILYNNWFGNLTNVLNLFPVVTYDQYSEIWVGWLFDNYYGVNSLSPYTATFPIVVACSNKGIPTGTNYLEVPNTINYQAMKSDVSLAGRNSSDLMLAHLDYLSAVSPIATDLIVKWLPSVGPVSNLKLANSNEASFTNLVDILTLHYQTLSPLTLFVYNTNGQVVMQQKGDAIEIQQTLLQQVNRLPKAIYAIKISTADGKFNFANKFLIGQ